MLGSTNKYCMHSK